MLFFITYIGGRCLSLQPVRDSFRKCTKIGIRTYRHASRSDSSIGTSPHAMVCGNHRFEVRVIPHPLSFWKFSSESGRAFNSSTLATNSTERLVHSDRQSTQPYTRGTNSGNNPPSASSFSTALLVHFLVWTFISNSGKHDGWRTSQARPLPNLPTGLASTGSVL